MPSEQNSGQVSLDHATVKRHLRRLSAASLTQGAASRNTARVMMDAGSLSQSPFAVVTFIAAPALLTNATSVLALSTTNRMLRTRERMSELFAKAEKDTGSSEEKGRIVEQVNRVEAQALLLLSALARIYMALGAFAAATLVTLVGAGLAHFQEAVWFRVLTGFALVLGFVGVGGLVLGSLNLFRATQLSLLNIRQEAALIRERHARNAVN